MDFRSESIDLVLSPIKEIELRANRIPGVISLAQGIPSFDTPTEIREYAIRAARQGNVSKYSLSPGLPELREVVERKLYQEGKHYDYANEILVTAGSIEGITATLLALLKPQDEVILFSPSYASYAQAVRVAHGIPRWVQLEERDGWHIRFDNLHEAITPKTKAIVFANPNNPTGTIFTKDELNQLADIAVQYDILLISDEVYKDFYFEGERPWSIACDPRYRSHLVYIYSFSKAYAMTGWRIAFLATTAHHLREILKVHDAMVTCAPVISQYAAIAALTFADAYMTHFQEDLLRRRNYICERFEHLSQWFSYQRPKGAYFLFPKRTKPWNTNGHPWDFSLQLLERAHVAVVPGSAFGPDLESYFRVCFGRSMEDIRQAMDRIESFLVSGTYETIS